jgi:hypothetical protein
MLDKYVDTSGWQGLMGATMKHIFVVPRNVGTASGLASK